MEQCQDKNNRPLGAHFQGSILVGVLSCAPGAGVTIRTPSYAPLLPTATSRQAWELVWCLPWTPWGREGMLLPIDREMSYGGL